MVHDLQIRAPYLKREEGAVAKKCSNVPTGFTLSVVCPLIFVTINKCFFRLTTLMKPIISQNESK